MLSRRLLRRVTAQINSGAVFIRSDAVLPRKAVPANGSGKPCGQRLELRLRLRSGRMLPHTPEQFQNEIALLFLKQYACPFWQRGVAHVKSCGTLAAN